MKEIQVRNMISTSGNYVPNQFEIKKKVKDYYQHYFQSYDTIICKYDVKGLILDINPNYDIGIYKPYDMKMVLAI